MNNTTWPAWLAVWVGGVVLVMGTACLGGGGLAPGIDDCANLRELKASADVSGAYGSLGDYDISFDASGDYQVVPPDTSDCAREIAAKLEAACRVCDKDSNSCESTVQATLDTPSEACSACGDDVCSPSETPSNCPEDCASACGNGTCEGDESFQSCPADCSQSGCGDGVCAAGENPVNCVEDCGNACGDGTCDPGESRDTCPADCTPPCGDGVCAAGENPVNCPVDCAAPCGDGTCEVGESSVLCPQDCGGCVPNQSACDGNTVVVCNNDGQTVTRRQCGAENVCESGSCRAEDPEPGQTDVEAELLGNWRVTVELRAEDDVERELEVGNAVYVLEIFQIEPPSGQFGVWSWKGALKAGSFCLGTASDFEGQTGQCTSWTDTALGRCTTTSCDEVTELAARGSFNAVDRTLEMEYVEAPIHHIDAQGLLGLVATPAVSGPLSGGEVAWGECVSRCTWTLRAEGGYDGSYPDYRGAAWSIQMSKL